ncbi:VQ motif-containing protein [Quillaja saponaria]|uniref:VQ motif-containing protein n=1 Tax=Quillaja saponaria TaxID=32244 RepID=A0AAD7PRX4_QUISA|nr:VQ motif-containing protein [Quillaja saponaria]
MESGNSGSGQSSSGDDQEYDSLDLNPHPQHPYQVFGNSLLLSHHQNHQPNTFFDLSPQYLHNVLSQSQSQSLPTSIPNNPMLNLDPVRSHGLRSELINCTDPSRNNQSNFSSSSSLQLDNNNNESIKLVSAPTALQGSARNPKKRTRASRRAPTTVLTTDTSNFRAMVQEFTGIPAPPFSAGGSSYSRRLNLSMGGFFSSRTSAQKVVQPNPLGVFSSSSSTFLQNNMVDAVASTTNIVASVSDNNINYQLQLPPPDHHHHHDLALPNYPIALTTFQPPILPSFGAKSREMGMSNQGHGNGNFMISSEAHDGYREHRQSRDFDGIGGYDHGDPSRRPG